MNVVYAARVKRLTHGANVKYEVEFIALRWLDAATDASVAKNLLVGAGRKTRRSMGDDIAFSTTQVAQFLGELVPIELLQHRLYRRLRLSPLMPQ